MNMNICNICSESIEENKVVQLKCNPTKHIFCYDCIYDWYKILKKPSTNFGNYTIKTMCPICRKNGGLLLLPNGKNFEIGIHKYDLIDDETEVVTTIKLCGYKLKSSNNTCTIRGNVLCGGLCKRHFQIKIKEENNINNTATSPKSTINTNTATSPIITTNNINLCVIINPNKKDNECGVKLKSKNDYCKSSSKTIYGGFCGIHKSYANNIPVQHNATTIII